MLSERAEYRIYGHLERLARIQGEAVARLDALSPLRTLARGYAVAERTIDGSVVREADTLTPGELLRLRLHRGSAVCRVEQTVTDPLA